MRFDRILLISPPSSSYLGAARPPQNLGYLAQTLHDNTISCDILDLRFGSSDKKLKKMIQSVHYDLIGVSLVSLEYLRSYQLIHSIRELSPESKIVAGGPHVTVLKEKVLEECSEIDYAVVNEGEFTLLELCQGNLDISEIKSLIYRNGNEIIVNGPRPLTTELDSIPWPRYQGLNLSRYIREMPFNSSRGCPYQCVFCPNKIMTRKYRYRSAENVVNEIQYWYEKGYRVFNYDDDNLTLLNERVYEICDLIEKRGLADAEYRCSNGIRADRVNRELLARMRDVGFNYIAFGVDGGNNKMLRFNKKGETIEQIEAGIRIACELGYDVKIFVITGMPHETEADIEDSIRLVRKYPVKRVILNNPIPYPGTELFDTVKANNWFITQPEEYLNFVTENENVPVFITPELGYKDRLRILKRIRQVEKEVTREAIARMFPKLPLLGRIAGAFFASDTVQRMFFLNLTFRRIMEWIRSRQWNVKRQKGQAGEISS